MSETQQSRDIYTVNVPDVSDFEAKFQYNFFTPNESIEYPESPQDASEIIDESYIKRASAKYPRFVVFNFKPVASDYRSNLQRGTFIKDNFEKIISEDFLSSGGYTAVTFCDAQIDDKLYTVANSIRNDSEYDSFRLLSTIFGSQYADNVQHVVNDRIAVHNYFENIKRVTVNSQINNKFIDTLLSATTVEHGHVVPADLKSDDLGKNKLALLPFVDILPDEASYGHEIVGYVIDKYEILESGDIISHDSIIVENPNSTTAIDYRVKYGSTYAYTIRTVCLFYVRASDIETGNNATLKILVSSRPTHRTIVHTVESIAPMPPIDLEFTWSYDRKNYVTGKQGSLLIHWAFPINSQRDIKQFQIFRRKKLEHPFELIKVYDFNDSYVKYEQIEQIDQRLIEQLRSPKTFYFDDDFVSDSRYIYAICAVDAHGMISNYSTQHEVWFDKYKNELKTKLVSRSGAPRPYPNMYIDGELFASAIKTSGVKQMKLYFNPEFYEVIDNDGSTIKSFKTVEDNCRYQFKFVNIDNNHSASIDVSISKSDNNIA